jgi:hypothetical protein
MKKLVLFIFLSTPFFSVIAQQSDFTSFGRGVSTTFVTDYHVTGINPANLGFKRSYETKHVTFGLFETGLSAYSGAIGRSEFRKSLTSFGSSDFDNEQKRKAASQFAGENFAANADINILGVAYQNDKIGGFAFNVRETGRWFSTFNKNFSDLIFLGLKAPYFTNLELGDGSIKPNDPSRYEEYENFNQGIVRGFRNPGSEQMYSEIFDGSRISMMYYREYALSYGKEITLNDMFAVAGGLSLKYLQGYGVMDIQAKDGKLTAYSSFSPAFGFDFGNAAKTNPSADTSGSYKSVGNGFGTDLGFNVTFKEKIKLGIAVTNIGSISWKGNIYTAQDTLLYDFESEGFEGYNLFSEAGQIAADDGLFKWKGNSKLVTKLPTTLRIGASHKLEDKAEIGIDMIFPLNDQPGTLKKPYWALGGDIKVLKFLRLSSGIAYGGNYDKRVNIPVGITFVIGEQASWEIGFASRDAITYFREKGPALSFAFGFLRFRA